MIKELEDNFIGTGSVSGFKFKKLHQTELGYLYEVDSGDEDIHYEVFEKKISPICIDFDTRTYSKTEYKEVYPRDEDFGKTAFCCLEYKEALDRLNNFEVVNTEEEDE